MTPDSTMNPPSLLLKWALMTVLSLGQSLSAEASRNPSDRELRALFEIATRPLPEKMLLAAKIEISEPPMEAGKLERLISESVDEAVADEKRRAKLAGGKVSQSDMDDLKTLITEDLRRRFAGKRRFWRKEWYAKSGKLYRTDSIDYLDLESDPILRTNIVSGKIPCAETKISFASGELARDTRFPNGHGITINHGIQSASVHSGPDFTVSEPELWPVLSMKAELAFPIGVLLAKADSIPEETPFRDMLLGAEVEQAKLEQAKRGEVMGWQVVAQDDVIGTTEVCRLTFKGQSESLFSKILDAMIDNSPNPEMQQALANASSAEFSYWIGHLDSPEGPKLYRAAKTTPGQQSLVVDRRWDGSTDRLTTWSFREQNLENDDETVTSYDFEEVDLKAEFSDEEIFGYGQLAHLDYVDYEQRIVQHPEGVRILDSPNRKARDTNWMGRVLLLAVIALPVFYIRKLFVNSPERPS